MKKIKIVSLTNGRVCLSVADLHLRLIWAKKGAIRITNSETIMEAYYSPGVSYLFEQGLIQIVEDENGKQLMEDLGLSEEKIVVFDDAKSKRLLTVMPFSEFKKEVNDAGTEQVNELAQFAIKNQFIDVEKSNYFKERIGTDILKSIQLKMQNEESVKKED